MNMKLALKLLCLLAPTSLFASEDIADQYPDSMLYAKPVEFIPGVFSATGATAPPTYDNAGHNNNLSFIITGEGVVVVNGGGSYLLAKALHDEIKAITDQEVVLIVDENGQGHAMLGNSYWVGQGVKIIAHVDAAAEFEERGFRSLASMQRLNKERGEGTFVQGPTETFTDEYSLELGDFQIEVRYLGPSHSAGDVVVWLPKQSLVIAGDMAFHERLLPIFEDTYTLDWLETWDTEFEALNATYVIPGHGHPTNMAQVRRYTKGYLEHLRGQIGTLIEDGGGLAEAYYVDQSPYVNLDTFEELATKNAGRVYEQMEFE
ncbi:MAG: glyoxylase-like metal-dependent hydrolase (beta-lactamase superfamily II) [Gammaproteobacteria bacterium]|jgi:glyoxylase-like metal-dependent hydrolase (beta-lactamase superfamily II)